jgi:phage shock protein PspC (stress-responsive transcriptional regulator)
MVWRQVTRRLTRSQDDKVLFGVCGGIAQRFGVDAVWVRLGFVALALLFGKGVLLYLLLTIVLPKSPALPGSSMPAFPRG